MIAAPTVYVGGTRWPDTIADACPALAGLTYSYRRDSDRAQDAPERATVTILQRTQTPPPAPIDIGRTLVITSDPADALTYFTGTIEDVDVTFTNVHPWSDPDALAEQPAPVPAIQYRLTAVDLANRVREDMTTPSIPAERGDEREIRWMAAFNDLGWNGRRFDSVIPFTSFPPCAEIVDSQQVSTLTLMDHTLASCRRSRRYSTKRNSDGSISRWVDIMDDPTTTVSAETLDTNDDGTWTQNTTFLLEQGMVGIPIPSAAVALADMAWTKKRGDLNTEVLIERPTVVDGQPGTTTTAASSLMPTLPPLQLLFGKRQVTVSTDLAQSATTAQLVDVATAWTPTQDDNGDIALPWSVDSLPVVRPDLVPDVLLGYIMSTQSRYGLQAVVTGPIVNAPAGETTRPRAAIIGADITWTGKKWTYTLALSRSPKRPVAGDWWTCQRVAADPREPVNAGTCTTVGDTLTVADFAWIGPNS